MLTQNQYAASPAYAQTGFFRALVAEVARRWPEMDVHDLVQVLSLDTRRYNMMALQEGGPFEAREFADEVLGIHHAFAPNIGFLAPQPRLIGQNRYDFTVFSRAFHGIPEWSQDDVDQSRSEGWIISSLDDGTEKIQKYDEGPIGFFDTDAEAQDYVDSKAAVSDDPDCLHSRAIRYVVYSHGST